MDDGSLKPFARDLGGVLGSASFHSGRPLGVTGFDIGAHGGMQFRPEKNDRILRDHNVHAFGVPWVQAELGLPFRMDGFIRGISYQGLTIAGGGLRYGIRNVIDAPWTPQPLVSWVAHSVTHSDFTASHMGLNLVISCGIPVFTPYLAAGVDRTRVVVRQATTNPTMIGTQATTTESRFTGGVRVRPYPFTYLQAAMTLAHGIPGADVGLGLRF
ncbi:MAG: hypothetical protein HY078_17645 [Elusimicrobia bacterium]|nr:hypothetical protein [Elusimicrobiota bacterium]